MSSRPILPPYKVIINGAMVSNITSKPTIIQNLSMLSYDVTWAGSGLSGTIQVQVSNTATFNAAGEYNNDGNWTTITPSSISVAADSGGGFIDIDQIAAYAIRLTYTAGGGTGVLQATINGKVA